MRTLIDFDDDPSEPRWVAVNDDVMGGHSSGEPTIKDGKLLFSGTLSRENNGGFSSVRTVDFAIDLSDCAAVVLRVLGDGRRYQLRLATRAEYQGIVISYGVDFVPTASEWTSVHLSLDSLQPSVRGALLKGPRFDRANVRQIGLLIGDRQEGPFSLLVDWIHVG